MTLEQEIYSFQELAEQLCQAWARICKHNEGLPHRPRLITAGVRPVPVGAQFTVVYTDGNRLRQIYTLML